MSSDSSASEPRAGGRAGSERSSKALVVAAVVVGVIFVILLNLQGILDRKRLKDSQVKLVLITADLPSGSVLSASNTRAVTAPSELVAQAPGLYLYRDLNIGVTAVKRPVIKNDLLRLNDLVEPVSSDDTLSRRLRGDRRVVSLLVDRRQPSAFIRSGSRVDVYGVLAGSRQTLLVIENLEVLSIDGEIDIEGSRRNFRSIETHIPAELVEQFMEVQRRCTGVLQLAVRRPGDMTMQYPFDINQPELGGTISTKVRSMLGGSYGTNIIEMPEMQLRPSDGE